MCNPTIDKDGTAWWYNEDGHYHRIDGPAIESADGDNYWYVDGVLHRLDGPAVDYATGGKSWYVNGELHRVDGPAIECANGDKYWYIEGKEYTEEEFLEYTALYRFVTKKEAT